MNLQLTYLLLNENNNINIVIKSNRKGRVINMEEMKKDNMQEKSSGWKKWVAIATVAVASFFGVNVQDVEAGSAYNKVTQPHKIHQKVTVPNIVDSKKIVDMKFGKNKVVVTKKVYKARN